MPRKNMPTAPCSLAHIISWSAELTALSGGIATHLSRFGAPRRHRRQSGCRHGTGLFPTADRRLDRQEKVSDRSPELPQRFCPCPSDVQRDRSILGRRGECPPCPLLSRPPRA